MNNKLTKLTSAVLVVMCVGLGFKGQASAAPVFSDFEFGAGTPFGGTTTLGGNDVTLVTTNTQPFGLTSFRDLTNTSPATVTFTFSDAITEFSLDVSRVHPDELLTGFNIGDPTSLSGTLINVTGNITTSGTDDFGFGRLGWAGINTPTVSFTIGNFPNPVQPPALAVDQFGISAEPSAGPSLAVPEPATFGLLGLGIGLLMATCLARRRRA